MIVVTVLGLFFLLPLLAMLSSPPADRDGTMVPSTRGGCSSTGATRRDYPDLSTGIATRSAGRADRGADAGAAGADHDLGPAAAAPAAPRWSSSSACCR